MTMILSGSGEQGGLAAPMLRLASALLLVGVLIASVPAGVESIGACNGVIGSDLPPAHDVVQLYKSNGITAMRFYNPQPELLDALRGSGIAVILGTANADVPLLASKPGYAASWVATNVQPYYPSVNISYITVGNEITGDPAFKSSILPAMKSLHFALAGALGARAAGGIKVSTALRFDALVDTFPPSKGAFKDAETMVPLAGFLASTGAPLLADVYPYFAYRDNPKDIALSYATFQPGSTPVRDDGSGLVYTTLFDAMVDALYSALEKAGEPAVRVVVSESGWPSAGGFGATVENARAYNQGLIDHVGKGTPKRPGAPVEAYIFSMFNENLKPGDETERHFGLFYPSKAPVCPISFHGVQQPAAKQRQHAPLKKGAKNHTNY
ncbi:glucan endo-1,3-beta-glucosidase GV [Brachypodium distachyon]|uniref:Glucan endo-1,3-beta-D-glucosidase n=1 Tax=Brachypodium distachyon TaxID=15368 RepID=I1HV52_BRADI|nr:glucan endo-1,3-beta-glucosidase GV [Brachypodium distachyon]PNT73588.1 hypothetical protein BRADI_2g60557v3 [Brachypodium distachyon]|eukprot:XP_010232812.1 glucan endo-1,3-beta-glucosidase GV [Brachypodium distachyon]